MNILQYALIIFALLAWVSALALAFSSESMHKKFTKLFSSHFKRSNEGSLKYSLIDRNSIITISDEEVSAQENEQIDSTELQSLRNLASEDKIIFSEKLLQKTTLKAKSLEKSANDLLLELIESAKASYPRIDGYIKIDENRYSELV